MFSSLIPQIAVETQDRPYTKPLLIGILILAAVLRFGFLLEIQNNPMPVMVSQDKAFDQYNYWTMAMDLLKHNWLGSIHPGHSPVYSYLLALLFSIFGADMNVVFIFQIFYGVLSVYLIYRCGVLLFRNKNLGLLAALIAAAYSPFIYYECALLRESVIAYTNLVAFYFFLLALYKGKGKNFVLGGVFLGLSFILRAGIFPVFVLGYMLLSVGGDWRQRLRKVGLILVGMAIVILPLTIRNYVSGFQAFTETSGPTLFWLGNSYDSPGIGLTYTPTQEALTAETQGRVIPTIKVLWREMKAHPIEYRDLFARKFKMLFNGYEIPANLSYDLFKELSWVLNMAPFNFVLISPLALLALILFWRKDPTVGLLYVYIFSLTIFVFIFHIQSRYRVAFIPFYILAASYTLFWLGEMFYTQRYKAFVAGGILFMGLFMFTYPDKSMMTKYFDGGIRSIDYANMASSYLARIEQKKLTGTHKSESLRKAIFYYDKALPLLFDSQKVSVYITEGMIYDDLGLRVRALDCFAKALELDPQNAIARRQQERVSAKIF